MTELLLGKGEIVVATLRSPAALSDLANTYTEDRLLILKCDVTCLEDIKSVFSRTIESFGRCDIVFNNAGLGYVSEAESEDQDELARQMFEVNFWGAMHVSREAVRVFRDVNPAGSGGRLLTTSTGSGVWGNPALSFYSAR